LVKQGHDINECRYSSGMTPLLQACKNNNIEVIETLCILKANVNIFNNAKSALYYCCSNGNLDAVKLLISLGAEVDKENILGKTPFILQLLVVF
jgi:ankyrin repeat protein